MLSNGPTLFPDLNAVLNELVDEAAAILSGNFVGGYLQGSFALGDADVHSDVDFVMVTEGEVTPPQEHQLREMHRRFPDHAVHWAHNLEGSYVPRDALRRFDRGEPWLYVDNGQRVMERSVHDNDRVVRWVLRNHGVVLTGPDPHDLVDPVTADELRTEVSATMREWAAALQLDDAGMDNAWRQPYVVLSFCRMLHTVQSGRVTSKLEAGRWALEALDPAWSGLIQRALDRRPDPWVRVHHRGDPADVRGTWGFIDYALGVLPDLR